MTVPIQEPRNPPVDLRIVAVSCGLNHFGGTHTGFLYERDDMSRWFCDVAWDLISRNMQVQVFDCCWTNINIRPEILEFLAAALENMDQNTAAIPYDVRYSSLAGYFDTKTWSYQTNEPGLTCATFVLAMLRGFFLELFDVAGWPSRVQDRPALETLITNLEQRGVDPQRIAAMRANHNDIRFRPEEVCASVSESAWPVPHATAEKLGLEVLRHVTAR